MLNELSWIILIFVSFILVMISYAAFGKPGLYVWLTVALITANIQVLKTIEIFGYVTAMGNVLYGTTFLATDILSENHGKKEAKKGVYIGFFVLISVALVMQISLMFAPHESDISHIALETIFSFFPRIAAASIIAYLVSQLHDVLAFEFWRRAFSGRHLWIRNNLSTITSQLLDNAIFTFIAFIGFFGLFGWEQVFSWDVVTQIFLTSYAIKVVVAFLDTPFIYLARKIRLKKSRGASRN